MNGTLEKEIAYLLKVHYICVCYNKFYSTFPYNDVPLVRPPCQTDKKGSLEVSCGVTKYFWHEMFWTPKKFLIADPS